MQVHFLLPSNQLYACAPNDTALHNEITIIVNNNYLCRQPIASWTGAVNGHGFDVYKSYMFELYLLCMYAYI